MSETSARTLLQRLGIGDFNATMIIPYLFTSAMTTDPKSPQIILLVKAIQKRLNDMGAGIAVTGYLDVPTASVLDQLAGGHGWTAWAWSDIISLVLAQSAQGTQLVQAVESYPIAATGDYTLGLPDVPGGVFTYAVGAFLLYRHLTKGRR